MHPSIGKQATDRITGFWGTVTGYVQYITGCNQLLVSPRVRPDGNLDEPRWIDEQRLEIARRSSDPRQRRCTRM